MKSYAPSEKSGGGTELKETVLWTNSNPSVAFAEQTVSLSDNYANYDYLKIEYAIARTNLTSKTYAIVSTEEFATYKNPNNYQNSLSVVIAARSTGGIFARYFCPASANSILISQAARILGSSSYTGSTDNNVAIPLNIYGVK